MDVWVPSDAEVRRTRLESQLFAAGAGSSTRWRSGYCPPLFPNMKAAGHPWRGLPRPPTRRRARRCGGTFADRPAPAPAGTRDGPRVDSAECVAGHRPGPLAGGQPGARVLPEILKLAGAGEAVNWCAAPMFPADLGSEWYLRLRDAVNRMLN